MGDWEHELLALNPAHETIDYFNEDPEEARNAETHIENQEIGLK